MRRLLPRLAALLATLLLAQWGQGAASCLAVLRFDPASAVCHVADSPASGAPPHQAGLACPHCAPLPPALAASPPALPPTRLAASFAPPPPPSLAPHPPAILATANQPRAPPARA